MGNGPIAPRPVPPARKSQFRVPVTVQVDAEGTGRGVVVTRRPGHLSATKRLEVRPEGLRSSFADIPPPVNN
ncbi:MAG: hypothetical protein ACOC7J_06820 [Armatimonadota bacterium]